MAAGAAAAWALGWCGSLSATGSVTVTVKAGDAKLECRSPGRLLKLSAIH
jgi:hypothetical protein